MRRGCEEGKEKEEEGEGKEARVRDDVRMKLSRNGFTTNYPTIKKKMAAPAVTFCAPLSGGSGHCTILLELLGREYQVTRAFNG